MATKDLVFDPQDLVQLLVHYTDGEVPLSGQISDFLVHPYLTRKIGLLVESPEWDIDKPLFLNYDGKRIASWTQDSGVERDPFEEKNDTPRRQ